MASTILSHQSSAGFYKSPVTKGLIGMSLITSTAIHLPLLANLRQYVTCEIPSVLFSRNIWRLVLNRLTFLHPKDIICSALVLYYFRIFEKRMGSRKFSSFLFGTCTITTLLEICMVLLLKYLDYQFVYENQLHPGLYGVIFPLYVYYFFDIPRTVVSQAFGISITGKSITYLLGLQVATTSSATMISSICGIIAGMLYRYNFFWVQKWLVIPKVVANMCDKVLGWCLSSKEPKYRQMGATIELQRQEQADLWEQQYLYQRTQEYHRQERGQGFAERLLDNHADGGLAGLFFRRRDDRGMGSMNAEPSPENIRILMDMGFEQSRATEALRSSSNDLETATNILLRQ